MCRFSLRILCLSVSLICYNLKGQKVINSSLKTIGFGADAFTSNIHKIIRDKNNFLWLSTLDALCKYDGVNILHLIKKTASKPGLLGTDCIDMDYQNGEDFLYVLSGNEGLNIIDVNTNSIVKQETFPNVLGKTPTNYSFLLRQNDELLILCNQSTVIYYNIKERKIKKAVKLFLPSNTYVSSFFFYRGLLCTGLSNNQINFFEQINFKLEKTIDCSSEPAKFMIGKWQVIDHFIWFTSLNGIKCIDLEKGKPINIEAQIPDFPKGRLNISANSVKLCNNKLFFSNQKGVFAYDLATKTCSDIISNKNEEDESFLQSTESFFCNGNRLWMGGLYGLCDLQMEPFFKGYYRSTENSTIRIGQAFQIIVEDADNVMVLADDGFYELKISSGCITKKMNNQFFNSAVKLNNSLFLVSGANNLFTYKNSRFIIAEKVYPELSVLKGNSFNFMEMIDSKEMLFTSNTANCLYLWNMHSHVVKKLDGLSDFKINTAFLQRTLMENKTYGLLLSATALQQFDLENKTCKTVFDISKVKGESSETFMDICRQKNSYWIAAYGFGLVQLDSDFNIKKTITTKDGIGNLGIYKVFNIADSLIVATSNSGLIVYNCINNNLKTFYGSDGLNPESFNQLSGYQNGDTLYLGGVKGITIFNAKKLTTNSNPPQLYFNTISYETPNGTIDTTNLFIKYLEIPNNVIQTKISFTAINYSNPQRVQYWYRIKGLQDNWAELQGRNFIPLVIIPPGHYTVEIKAANEDGVECKPISMELHFLPKWYQTLLFYILLGIAIAGILYALYKYQINQYKKQQQIRHEIASDLHDDIGSLLNSAKVFNNLAKLQPDHGEYLSQTDESLAEASISLRDMIWVLDNSEDTIKELMSRILKFAIPITNASNIKFQYKINVSEKNNIITKTEKRNLFLIIKEFINNSIKYAACENITIDFYENKKGVILNIMDDGKGFDLAKQTAGNGLRNMAERARQINCTCEIIASEDKGARIIIARK